MNGSRAIVGVVCGLMLVAAAAEVATAAGATRAQIDDIIKQLRTNADLWWRDQDIQIAPEVALKSVWFDKTSAPALSEALRSIETDPNGLYVINRLLRQLSFAKTETIRAVLPTVKAIHSKMKDGYKPLLKLSDRQIKALKEPTSNSPNAREALQQRRAEKVAKERLIAKHNQMIGILERRTFVLMLLAEERDEDKALCNWLINAEKQKDANFLAIVEALAADARKMSKERAEQVYKLLRPYGVEVKMEKRTAYADRGKVIVKDDDASTYETRREYPGIKILSMLNRIATAARTPALKVPKDKDVEKYLREQAKKRRTSTSRR